MLRKWVVFVGGTSPAKRLTGMFLPGCGFGVADFGGVAGKVGKVGNVV